MPFLQTLYPRIESRVLSSFSDEPLLRPRMPELDSVRGLAILMVLIFHGFMHIGATTLPSTMQAFIKVTLIGRLGVNLFFVLSGFLITGLLLDSVARADYFRHFYVRRLLRIVPAFCLTLIALAVTHDVPGHSLALSATFLANLSPLFGVATAYVVLWSLAVEEHFYLVWPTIVRRVTTKNLLRLCVAILLVEPIARVVSYELALPNGTDWNDVTRYTWNATDGLALGAIIALGLRQFHVTRTDAFRIASLAIAAGAALFCIGIPFGITVRHTNVFGAAFQEVPWNFAFAGLVMLFLVLGTGRWKALVVPRPLLFFGRISYGLYLVHMLVFDEYDAVARRYLPYLVASEGQVLLWWIRFAIASGGAILLAWLSRETLEEFFLNLHGRHLRPRAPRRLPGADRAGLLLGGRHRGPAAHPAAR